VIMTKAQADHLTGALSAQSAYIKQIKLKHDRLKTNHFNLLQVFEDCRIELMRTNHYNDSLINHLGTNMALLYKMNDSSEVFFVDLKYYTVDVFRNGTIFLTSMNERERGEARVHMESYPEWKFLNVANELDPSHRDFVDYVRLYPSRHQNRLDQELYLRP